MEKYYRILDLPPNASEQEVKQAYRELVKVWHPDRFTHDIKLQRRAEEKLKIINDAYQRIVDYLNNPYARQQSQQYQSEKREKPDSQAPPKQPYNSWICPACLRTNYMDNLSCGCGFRSNAADVETYSTKQTAAGLYESILFNKNMNYMDRAAFLSRYLLIRFPNSKEAEFIKQGVQSSTSSDKKKPHNQLGVCQRCGQHRVIFHGEFHENISYFFRRKERTIDAELCFPCTGRVFIELTGRTLLLTWWGIIGAIVGPIYIISNSGWFLFNSFKFLRQKIRKDSPSNAAASGKSKPNKLRHLKKNWGWYLFLGLIVIAMINSALNPSPTRKQISTLPDVPKQNQPAPRFAVEDPVFAEPIQPLPANGAIKRYVKNEAIAPLRIVTQDSSNHYYVKIVDWDTKKKICTVFIRAGQSVNLDLPLGIYRLRYATGERWYGTKFLFGPETTYNEADQQLDFDVRGDQVHGYTIELFLTPNGNLKTNGITAAAFEENDDR